MRLLAGQGGGRRVVRLLGGVLLLALALPALLGAQGGVEPPPTRPDSVRPTTPPIGGLQDTLRNKRLGLPTAPERIFRPDDSVLVALLARGGFRVTRFQGDSGELRGGESAIRLMGRAAMLRDSGSVEAEGLVYRQDDCTMTTQGATRIFDNARPPSIGRSLRLELCKDRERMVLTEALTVTNELGGDWFLRGNLAVDSSAKRLFMARGEFTTCDLPEPEYHFEAGQVKWIGQSVLVARPAVLYVKDVPVMWLPFLFQDTRPGRRSGILIPQFGLNDLVRPTRSYRRQVTNIGYYWAPSDYVDATARLDWYASRHLDLSVESRYQILNRFVEGGIGYRRQIQDGGGTSSSIRLNHRQSFGLSTSLTADIDYTTNTSVALGNAIDPYDAVRQASSSFNLTRRAAWGQLTLGGTRRQSLTDGSGQMSFPTLNISPRQVAIARNMTWSPSLSFSNSTTFQTPMSPLSVITPGLADTLSQVGSSRSTTLQFNTPVQLGPFNLQMRMSGQDDAAEGRVVLSRRIPDPDNPSDSATRYITRGGDFRSAFNWDVGLDLWQFFRSSWRLTPRIGITNIYSGGGYMIRSAATNGAWVQQGKRFEAGLSAAPTFYGFLNTSVGRLYRMRHEVSPSIQVQYSPEASLPQAYADALTAASGGTAPRLTPPRLQVTMSLTQNLSAKLRPAPGDTTSDETRYPKVDVFSLTTSAVSYDFEQNKLDGRSGWTTQSLSNSLQSDLLPGMQFSFSHDLWEGVAGSDSARFKPFLSSVQANVSLRGSTFRSLLALVGLGERPKLAGDGADMLALPSNAGSLFGRRGRLGQPSFGGMGGGFNASLSYSLQRTRPFAAPVQQVDPITGLPILDPFRPVMPSHSSIGLNTSFAPTANWSVVWQTQYNATAGRFESHTLQLQRDLHDWRASFNLSRSPNGNFALLFSIALIGFEQDIKFDYQQTTTRPLSGVP